MLNATPGAVAGWLLGLDAVGILAMAGITFISSSGVIARLLNDLRRLGNRETPAVAVGPGARRLRDGGLPAAAGGPRRGRRLGGGAVVDDGGAAAAADPGAHADRGRVAEHLHASAAVGAFLVGLTLTGKTADRARTVLGPLRDLFAAVFFLAIGFSVDPPTFMAAVEKHHTR